MNKVLLVDDDALTLRMYCEGLLRQGFLVQVAADGFGALRLLRSSKFDVAVLDLMMPRFSGYEVLKYVRKQPDLADLPVIILSNAYLRESGGTSFSVGAQRELLKTECPPPTLGRAIKEVLGAHELAPNRIGKPALGSDSGGKRNGEAGPVKVAGSEAAAVQSVPRTSLSELTCAGGRASPSPSPINGSHETRDKEISGPAQAAALRRDFLRNARAHWSVLRDFFERYKLAETPLERQLHLTDLFRKVRFVSTLAASAGFPAIARLGTPFEVLLYRYMDRMDRANGSMLRTMASGIDFLHVLLEAATGPAPLPDGEGYVLVVDDDELHNRAVVTALEQAQLPARSTSHPLTAWEWLQATKFDLVLLDIEMPGLDGFELCRRLRKLPGYATSPVIYITARDDFESRAQALLAGADDFITKPIISVELAFKALMSLLKSRLPRPGTARVADSAPELMATMTL